MDFSLIETDVFIIGAGAAGLRCAIELQTHGVECLVVSKRRHGDAHTRLAAGGINASLGSLDEEDDWTLHAADTLREGGFVSDPKAVELLARLAPERIRELAQWGCPFARTEEGAIDQRYFGAQSYRRTCFVGDRTGEAVLETLVGRAKEVEVKYRENVYVTEILVEEGRAVGALGFDMESGQGLVFSARAVVLAAGGCTGLYRRSSSRRDENTGDAMGLALRAGAELRDMEFIQFHPTGMVSPEERVGELVTEAVRGEGGKLFNAEGKRFMENYDEDSMELAARDVVARAVAREVMAGRGTKHDGVFLDISHKGKEFIKERLPTMFERFQKLGIDISEDPIEVAPTAHYAMGGVKVDFETGATTLEGLFAVGEATAGVHGANRLGGNSLAETVVFGQLTGAHLAEWLEGQQAFRLQPEHVRRRFEELAAKARQHGRYRPATLIEALGRVLEKRAGILRDLAGLEAGLYELTDLRLRAENLQVFTRPGTKTYEEVLNLGYMLDTAELILRAALAREESRGAHYRDDFPETEEEWKVSLVCRRREDGVLEVRTEAVGEPSSAVQDALEKEVRLDYHHLE